MMKTTKTVLLGLCCVLVLAAAGYLILPVAHKTEAESIDTIPVDVTIGEKMFISQTDDIYYNANDFLGKTIKLEGMFFDLAFYPSDPPFYTVIRNGPGCCGNDGSIGFEVRFDEKAGISAPNNNDWVEAIGILEEYEIYEQKFLRLNLIGLKVLDVRGLETVLQ
ncbi:MAG: hypothetical protein FWG37_00040 [Clostridia bacterium]|nr:hypothetical protein [Clostridia bacterium]